MAYIDPNPRTKPSLGNMETEFNAFVEKLPYDELGTNKSYIYLLVSGWCWSRKERIL